MSDAAYFTAMEEKIPTGKVRNLQAERSANFPAA